MTWDDEWDDDEFADVPQDVIFFDEPPPPPPPLELPDAFVSAFRRSERAHGAAKATITATEAVCTSTGWWIVVDVQRADQDKPRSWAFLHRPDEPAELLKAGVELFCDVYPEHRL